MLLAGYRGLEGLEQADCCRVVGLIAITQILQRALQHRKQWSFGSVAEMHVDHGVDQLIEQDRRSRGCHASHEDAVGSVGEEGAESQLSRIVEAARAAILIGG